MRSIYSEKALYSMPRLLTLLDREPTSKTYGCFHRDYWLYKTSDFPDIVRQFGVLSLALVYEHQFPNNIYFKNEKIAEWTAASLRFWADHQHADGSFDEFYPYERGWVGPTAFTAYACAEALLQLKDAVPQETRELVIGAIRRSADFICAGDHEKDSLANHHAMACLAVWKAYELTGDEKYRIGFNIRFKEFLAYHNEDEGWSLEYDGIDPGYLSASISFLGKVYKHTRSPELLAVLRSSIETCSLFSRPDGDFAGNLGSRNTQHFYPHGFELLASDVPIAGSVAQHHLEALAQGRVVAPEIMSDRYVFYRVPELLQSYIDFSARSEVQAALPFQTDGFRKWLPKAKILALTRGEYYGIVNAAKGGVVKVFSRETPKPVFSDSGIVGQCKDGRSVTSQWVDESYQVSAADSSLAISGNLHVVPSNKVFTILKMIIFRTVLLLFGWYPAFCHYLKGRIRASLILKAQTVPIRFARTVRFSDSGVIVETEIVIDTHVPMQKLSIGGERFLRFVPQSRFFQRYELEASEVRMTNDEIETLNKLGKVRIRAGSACPTEITFEQVNRSA